MLAAALLLAAPLLSACESVIAAQAEPKYPPPGKLVEVAPGRRIQIDCRGEGSPTVVFQSGGDVLGSLAWTPVQDRIAANARACAYSRAGVMWSDPDPRPFAPEQVAQDLHAALDAAGETGPYVLVAHSRGGLYNLIYAGMYPDQVTGLVFVDSSHPDQELKFAEAGVPKSPYVSASQELGLAFAWTGVMRLAPYPTDPSVEGPVRAFYPKSAAANAREARQRDASMAVAGRYRDLRNWPVVVLARELPELTKARADDDAANAYLLSSDGTNAPLVRAPEGEKVWRNLETDLAGWSSRGRIEIVPNSNHAFFFTQPQVVADAVNEVLAASRVRHRPMQQPGLRFQDPPSWLPPSP
jgi:pimeloyl-ACP methyl ester carboxylesterase